MAEVGKLVVHKGELIQVIDTRTEVDANGTISAGIGGSGTVPMPNPDEVQSASVDLSLEGDLSISTKHIQVLADEDGNPLYELEDDGVTYKLDDDGERIPLTRTTFEVDVNLVPGNSYSVDAHTLANAFSVRFLPSISIGSLGLGIEADQSEKRILEKTLADGTVVPATTEESAGLGANFTLKLYDQQAHSDLMMSRYAPLEFVGSVTGPDLKIKLALASMLRTERVYINPTANLVIKPNDANGENVNDDDITWNAGVAVSVDPGSRPGIADPVGLQFVFNIEDSYLQSVPYLSEGIAGTTTVGGGFYIGLDPSFAGSKKPFISKFGVGRAYSYSLALLYDYSRERGLAGVDVIIDPNTGLPVDFDSDNAAGDYVDPDQVIELGDENEDALGQITHTHSPSIALRAAVLSRKFKPDVDTDGDGDIDGDDDKNSSGTISLVVNGALGADIMSLRGGGWDASLTWATGIGAEISW